MVGEPRLAMMDGVDRLRRLKWHQLGRLACEALGPLDHEVVAVLLLDESMRPLEGGRFTTFERDRVDLDDIPAKLPRNRIGVVDEPVGLAEAAAEPIRPARPYSDPWLSAVEVAAFAVAIALPSVIIYGWLVKGIPLAVLAHRLRATFGL